MCVLQGFGFVEFADVEAAAAARAAMDGAALPVPVPSQSRSPPRQQRGRLLEMGFSAQDVARAVELAGGSEEAALMLLLDGAVDSQQQQQQQQQTQPLSVRFAKAATPAALPQSRPRDDSRGRDSDAVHVPRGGDAAAASDAAAVSGAAAVSDASGLLDAGDESDSHTASASHAAAASVVGGGAAAADASPRDWVMLQHPDDPSAIAFGNVVTREFSLQPPSGGSGCKVDGSEGC